MAIANFPTPTDDSGDGESGTPVDLAWADELEAAIEAVVTGADNPNVTASTIIDEVVEARGDQLTLAENIEALTQGADNPSIQAPAIIDEVIAARDGEADLLTRVTRAASLTESGEVSTGAQEFNGPKTFDDAVTLDSTLTVTGLATFVSHPVFEPGTSTGTTAPVSGVIYTDVTARTGSGTTETDASTYTLPANVLDTNGKMLRINAWFKTAAGASTRTVKLYWNGSSIFTETTVVASGIMLLRAEIARTGAATQIAKAQTETVTLGLNTATAANTTGACTLWDTLAATLSGTVAIKTTLQDSAAGTNITQLGFVIEVVG